MCREAKRRRRSGRSFQRDYGERERFLSPPLRRTRARDRAGRGVESRRGDTLFPCLSLSSPRRASTRLRRAGPVIPLLSEGAPWTRTRGRLARSTRLLFLLRGSYAAVGALARASPRDHGRYAVDPRAAAAAARNRVNASPVVLLVHFGRRPSAARDGGPLSPPPSSWIGSSTIREDSGRVSRARSSRANVQRSLVRARQVRRARKQSLVT